MGDTEKGNIDLLRSIQGLGNNQMLDISQIQGPMGQSLQNLFSFGSENGMRVAGIPPSYPQMPPVSPYSQMQQVNSRSGGQQMGLGNLGPCHSRSLSQPPVFNFDALPPIGPSGHKNGGTSELPPTGLPPRKLHRRSVSDVPFGLSSGALPPVGPNGGRGGGLQRTLSGGQRKLDGEPMDDLLTAYMNLDGFNVLSAGGGNEKNDNENREEMDSRTSNSKTKGSDNSDNDAESSANESGCSANLSSDNRKEGLKRSAGSDIVPTVRHQRSVSMDSFMGRLQLNEDSPNLPPSGQVSAGENSGALGMFSGSELEKIMTNEKLAEIAVNDPKRVKRILANRQSAARSKERKVRYISELEHKVQTLQNEATTLSAQLTMLQKDSEGLTSLNTELKLRLLAFEQQAQLRDALNDALTNEIQRLRIATGELPDPRTRAPNPFGFINCQMLQQRLPATPAQEPQQEPSSSTIKSESNSSHE